VALSSVDIPRKALGEYAGEIALQMAGKKKPLKTRKLLVSPKLVIRESSQVSKVSRTAASRPKKRPSKAAARPKTEW
jgi:hypothetical protein